jgi:hypothetical protein
MASAPGLVDVISLERIEADLFRSRVVTTTNSACTAAR